MPGTATIINIDGTPTDYADPWVDSLVGGGAWTDGNGGTVTIQWTAFQGTMDGQNSYGWTSPALNGLREALSLWESVANIDFVEVSGAATADVKFWWGTETQAGGPGVLGWSDLTGFEDYYENPASETRDVLFNAQDPAMAGVLGKGSLGLVTMVHEIGHLLGLAHPHDGGAAWDGTTFPGVSWWDPYNIGTGGLNQGIYTTMSYNFGWHTSQSGHTAESFGLQYGPMALDIAAIQAIYGANTSYASANNVYILPTASQAGTYWSSIWDTGGIDTISNAGSSNDSTIDLREAAAGINGGGYISHARDQYGKVIEGGYTIARGVVIENATGGSGNDNITGNAAVNRLEGGAGNDILDGGAGADTMVGGAGYDSYHVDDYGDVIVDDAGIDTVYSSLAIYTLAENLENLTLTGTGPNNATGNSLANVLTGNAGANILTGGGGADILDGLDGNDRLIVSDLSFLRADGGAGTDTLVLDGAGLSIQLATTTTLQGIERFDLTGTGNNTLRIDQQSVLARFGEEIGGKRVLVVERDQGDVVLFADLGWTNVGSFSSATGTFDRWVFGNAEVRIEHVEAVPLPSGTVLLSSLNGSTGFKLSGVTEGDFSGWSVASAGDVNGDGFDDVIVGANMAGTDTTEPGASYVVFGKASGFSSSIDLSTLNGSNGFKLSGVDAHDYSGRSVASAGDVNGDGFADIIIGARGDDWQAGVTYVVFGRASGFAAEMSLSVLNGSNGFTVNGAAAFDTSGWAVASAGDFNGDGYDDLMIGAIEVGAAYIVYGKASGFSASLELSGLTAANGVKLSGVTARSWTGYSLASAGDVNGDGFDDVIVGAMLVGRAVDYTYSGASYVVFGRASAGANINLSSLNGSNGFKLSGATGDFSGRSVASAGDVNGDGYADLIVGAANASPNGSSSGTSYVVFGKASGFAANLNLSTLNGSNGFKLNGAAAGDLAGFSVASAGDFNGDGLADLVVGAHGASLTAPNSGASYIVFGKASGFAANIDLSSLNGSDGLALWGEAAYDWSGWSVSSAGDVNGDGYDDLIIGARGAAANGTNSGASYVVFGGAFGGSTTPVTTIGTVGAEILIGGRGDDVLTGGGGGDVFHAGAGNDRLTVKDLAFRLADGGAGTDTLALGGSGLSLDLSSPLVAAKLDGVERIDLTGTGNNTLVVNQLSVLGGIGATIGGRHILVVERNAGDTVQFVEANWTKTGSVTNADGTFDRWVFGNAEVQVEQVASSPSPEAIPLSTLNGSNGFKLSGVAASDGAGFSVAAAGDINGDGYADVIVGARADVNGVDSGASYVVFGKGSGFAANTNLSSLDGSTGFRLSGGAAGDWSGFSVASAGDINGDGYADLIVGAPWADPHGNYSGASYVVFGKASGFAASLALSALNGSNGFKLSGQAANDQTGRSVASAGDFNGDGFDDLIVGAWAASPNGSNSGSSYIVYGKAAGFDANIDLSTLNTSTGVRLDGGPGPMGDWAGFSVASAGDVNGDGYDDVIVGARMASPHGNASGASYVVFGKASGLAATLDLTALNGSNGFKLSGEAVNDQAGRSVASAGDVNGDGFADLIIGANYASSGSYSGASYVVFGKASGFAANLDLSTLNGSNGFKLSGSPFDQSGYSVASAGDVNGDGYDDLIVGARFADSNGLDAGASYVVFGKASGFAATVDLSSVNGTTGFKLSGASASDLSGWSVASAGDVNGDGYDDLVIGAYGADANGADSGAAYVVFGAAFGGTVTTNGTVAAEMLIGSTGNDALSGGGGGDVFHAGAGNDRLTVNDLAFRLADGGAGTDTLALGGSGLLLDLSNPLVAAKIDGVERIDLTGTGNNTLVVNQLSVLGGIGAVVGGMHILVVERNYGDTVQFVEANWVKTGSLTNAEGTFDRWLLGNAEVQVEQVMPPLTGMTIVGTAGNDIISTTVTVPGQPLATSLGDVIDGAGGADTMSGGAGDDTYVVDNVGDIVMEGVGEGTDTVNASIGWALGANVEKLVLTGTGSINGAGNGLNNTLTGNAGANVLDGGGGADTMTGGAGDDTYLVDDTGDLVVEVSGGGTDEVQSAISYTLTANVERLKLLGTADINGTGNGLANVLTGNAGKNVLDGGAGADTMTGGAGNDTYLVDNVGDVVVEVSGGGYDTVLSSISWTLGTGVEYLTLTGTANIDGTGNGVGNTLTGNAGNNRLDGGAGTDKMAGGLGNDTYVVDNAGDVVTEASGEGTDTVNASVGFVLGANVENLVLTGTGDINGTGNGLANKLTGNAGKNVLDGGAGADTMTGGAGNDSYVVDNVGDVVVEVSGGGYDTVLASISWTLGTGVEYLTLTGTANIDATGNTGGNTLTGNAGNNRLDGGTGADKMAGGLGNDTYVVDNAGDVVTEGAGEGTDTVIASIGWTLGANIENLILTGTGDLNGTGNTLKNVLTGNAGKNLLDGGAGADTMTGGAGNDTYLVDNAGDVVVEVAGGGYDTVLASLSWTLGSGVEYLTLTGTANIDGTGNGVGNTLTGNAGNNRLDGGVGTDKMAGGLGDDTYVVDNAGDVVTEGAGEGTDTVEAWLGWTLGANFEQLRLMGLADLNGTGNSLDNALFGNAGKNVLNGGAGADTMTGGAGNDTYLVDNAGDVVVEVAGGGYDTVLASISWTLGASVEYLTLTGTANIDGTGNTGANTLTGNAGKNVLDGGAGADTMAGGLGDDTYIIDNSGDLVVEAVDGGTDEVQSAISYTLTDNVERLRLLGSGNLNATGNGLANVLTGTAGNNVLDGGAGADTMTGGAGDDTYIVDHAGDLVVEMAGGGIDTVLSSIGWALGSGVEKLTLTGTANIDGTGNGVGNVLIGNAGNNLLDGGVGADTMTGGLGDDTYIVDNTGDLVNEAAGGGIDTVLSSISHTLRANVEKLVLTGNDAIDGTGNTGDNVLTGNDADNVLDGGTGADTMSGAGGNDTYRVDNAGDVVVELANGGTDTVRASVSHVLAANVENLTLLGQADIDATGNALANTLTGNTGDNLLDGGLGADSLSGGSGNDTFRFSTALGPDNVDRLVLFNHNDDTIELDHAIFASLGTGALAAGAFNKGAVATQTDDRILYDSASKSLYYDADGLGGAAAVKFATIDAMQGGVLDHTDFLIV